MFTSPVYATILSGFVYKTLGQAVKSSGVHMYSVLQCQKVTVDELAGMILLLTYPGPQHCSISSTWNEGILRY